MAATLNNRRLVAILASDVVGYSRMMASDEVGTLAARELHMQFVVEDAGNASHEHRPSDKALEVASRTEPPPVRLTARHARDAPPSQAEEMGPEGRYAPENRLTALDHPLLPTSPSTLAPSRAKNPGTT